VCQLLDIRGCVSCLTSVDMSAAGHQRVCQLLDMPNSEAENTSEIPSVSNDTNIQCN